MVLFDIIRWGLGVMCDLYRSPPPGGDESVCALLFTRTNVAHFTVQPVVQLVLLFGSDQPDTKSAPPLTPPLSSSLASSCPQNTRCAVTATLRQKMVDYSTCDFPGFPASWTRCSRGRSLLSVGLFHTKPGRVSCLHMQKLSQRKQA